MDGARACRDLEADALIVGSRTMERRQPGPMRRRGSGVREGRRWDFR